MRPLQSANEINLLKDPVFVLTFGGPASGKSTIAGKALTDQYILDVDDLKPHHDLDVALGVIKRMSNVFFEQKRSFAWISTSSSLNTALIKLGEAKKHGFTTVILHVFADHEVRKRRVQERVARGGHGEHLSYNDIKDKGMYAKANYDLLTKSPSDVRMNDGQAWSLKQRDMTVLDCKTLVDYYYEEDTTPTENKRQNVMYPKNYTL